MNCPHRHLGRWWLPFYVNKLYHDFWFSAHSSTQRLTFTTQCRLHTPQDPSQLQRQLPQQRSSKMTSSSRAIGPKTLDLSVRLGTRGWHSHSSSSWQSGRTETDSRYLGGRIPSYPCRSRSQSNCNRPETPTPLNSMRRPARTRYHLRIRSQCLSPSHASDSIHNQHGYKHRDEWLTIKDSTRRMTHWKLHILNVL